MKTPLFLVVFFSLAMTFVLQTDLLQKRFLFDFGVPECPWCDSNVIDDVRFLPVNTLVTRLGAPADADFLADLIWFRTCYYFGAHALTDKEYGYLYYLLDRISDLAPRWELPYMFGAVVLYLEAGNPVEALKLIKKGNNNVPKCWELVFLKGYIFWKQFNNLEAASTILFKASQINGAPEYLSYLSGTLATHTGEKEFTSVFFHTVMSVIDDPLQKKIMQKKMLELKINE